MEMKQEFHETHDISLFKTKSVEELSSLWNLSTGYLRRFKKKYYPELIRTRNKIDKNLLEERLKNYLTDFVGILSEMPIISSILKP